MLQPTLQRRLLTAVGSYVGKGEVALKERNVDRRGGNGDVDKGGVGFTL